MKISVNNIHENICILIELIIYRLICYRWNFAKYFHSDLLGILLYINYTITNVLDIGRGWHRFNLFYFVPLVTVMLQIYPTMCLNLVSYKALTNISYAFSFDDNLFLQYFPRRRASDLEGRNSVALKFKKVHCACLYFPKCIVIYY